MTKQINNLLGPGPGRPAGIANRLTIIKRASALAHLYEGLMPLDIMMSRVTGQALPDGNMPTDEQFEAAVLTAPYVHAKLQAIAIKSDIDMRAVSKDTTPDVHLLLQTALKMSIESDGISSLPEAHGRDERFRVIKGKVEDTADGRTE